VDFPTAFAYPGHIPESSMPNQKKATLLSLVTVAMWSTVATAFKLALARLDVLQLLFFASLTSTLVLLAVLAVRGSFRCLGP
jgi:uncharacterized membrane protein